MYRPLQFLRKWTKRAHAHAEGGAETAPGLDEEALRTIYAIVSWLIDYPDEELLARLPQIHVLLAQADLPTSIRGELLATTGHLGAADVFHLRSDYVETFDTRRRGCLFLTYFTNGDTRKRGRALLEIKDIYRQAGLDMDDSQLPDHLTCVLEFAAGHDLRAGVQILLANRAGVELLRLHLGEIDSPWAGALRALCATLPPLDGDDIHAVRRLAADGPEEETVGLDGLGGYGDDAPPAAPPPPMATPGSAAVGAGCSSFPGSTPAAPMAPSPPAAPAGTTFIPLTDVTGVQS
ncbi:respiratory nitrate reductase chaperone NarJ [Brevibacterium sp. 239c]|uniref:nitrate reductase molybdenum cofactor assembly chaperone n=1 Tax=Brevibacterium sp. 239c TaxID=1965356 RepID=UPI000C44D5F9|nr:nitrate reductase molybdenum cofactor assembly chaperone [Brevibacterium sp. 239c]SMX98479.1 respiratory nitrate reductase chaperone NarJ [Brevibacterium sp. 239c]